MFEDEKLRVKKYKEYERNEKILNIYQILTSRKAKIIAIIIIILLTIHFQPTKETMVCNRYYQCKVEKQYLKLFTIHKQIKLSKSSKPVSRIHQEFHKSRHSASYNYDGYLNIINNKNKEVAPFTYYITSGSESYVKNHLEKEEQKFQEYIKNPKLEYKLSSMGNGTFLIVLFVVLCLILPIKKVLNLWDRI